MICSKSKLDPELDKIRSILLENGYPEHLINSTIKRKLQQLDSNPAHTVKKCPVNLSVPWIGNVSMKFEKQITSAVMRCFFSVEPRVVFTTRQLLPTTERDVLSSHHQNNVIYQILFHCDSRYVGRTSQRLEERIKQHIPKSILPFTNPPSVNIILTTPNVPYITIRTNSVLAGARTPFHLSALAATSIKSLNPLLCKQNEFVYSLKISKTFHWLTVSTFRRSFNQ